VELEKESFAEKPYYKWILTFNILVQALTSIFFVKLIVVQFCTCSISITCIKHHMRKGAEDVRQGATSEFKRCAKMEGS
jgi:hypothetical protein